MLNEFSLIRRYFAPLTHNHPNALNLLDDAALLPALSAGQEWVVTKDALVENIHFFPDDPPFLLAKKLLRVNFSDLAAKGAVPRCYFLATFFPKNLQEEWIAEFARGLAEDNAAFEVVLLGGDTVAHDGPLCFSLTALGEVFKGKMVKRSGAKRGDRVYVTGTIGDAALGLMIQQQPFSPGLDKAGREFLLSRYRLPVPPVSFGKRLGRYAHAAMDVSDGLLQDAGHIAKASDVQLVIERHKVPLSAQAVVLLQERYASMEQLLSGGDDYQLLFTASPEQEERIMHMAAELEVQVTAIGHVTAGEGVVLMDEDGNLIPFTCGGYSHF